MTGVREMLCSLATKDHVRDLARKIETYFPLDDANTHMRYMRDKVAWIEHELKMRAYDSQTKTSLKKMDEKIDLNF